MTQKCQRSGLFAGKPYSPNAVSIGNIGPYPHLYLEFDSDSQTRAEDVRLASSRLTRLVLAALVVSAPAIAQDRFCISGDLEHLNATQKADCSAKLEEVRHAAASLQNHGDWHFVLVCDAQGWQDYAAFSIHTPEELQQLNADTDLNMHTTYLRGDRLSLNDLASLRRTVHSEVALIEARKTAGTQLASNASAPRSAGN
jgi:hypothetical protein